jgi:glutaredoxin 3
LRVVASMILLVSIAGCNDSGPAGGQGPRGEDGLSPIQDAGVGSLVYSWVDRNGRIRMASRPEDIPQSYRERVVITDTLHSRERRLRADRVMVVDLREQDEHGPINYTLVDLDRLRGKKRAKDVPRDAAELGSQMAAELGRAVRGFLGFPAGEGPPTARVILYTAPWCGFCKKAAEHLREKGIAFQERDIEKDRLAASELSRKLREAGSQGAGVPVLDIDGTLVIGFSRERIDRLLDEP